MQNYNYKILFLLLVVVLFFNSQPLYTEKVVTTKKGEPDAYFGLKVNAVVTSTYGSRIRDKSSGKDNSKKDDRTGFSLPWTLLMTSKEWEDKKIFVEFWTEVFRANTFSSYTQVDNGNKSNPFTLGIRRGNIQKY